MKPPGTWCDGRYKEGIVTRVVSEQVAEVDGRLRRGTFVIYVIALPKTTKAALPTTAAKIWS